MNMDRLIPIALFLSIFFLLFSTGRGKAEDAPLPFAPGERLGYRLRWSFIEAGTATLEVHDPAPIKGEPAMHFVMTARSTPFIDNFYVVRDRVDAYTDVSVTKSVYYRKKQHEGSTRRNVTVRYDWDQMTAQYTNPGEKKKFTDIQAGTFDPLSILYYMRMQTAAVGKTFTRPVTDGKKCVIGKGYVKSRETIEVMGKAYDTFRVTPELTHIGGVFEKSKDAEIQVWFTADHRRIPVRVKSRVIVGSFYAELVSAAGLVP